MKVGSVFSGIGGLDLGLEWAGMEIVWQCEKDENCRKVLRHHWPDVELYKFVETMIRPMLLPPIQKVDVLAGGFPCQDLSVAHYGSHEGLKGSDSRLVYEMARVAKDVDAEWVIVENVPNVRNYMEGIQGIFDRWEMNHVTFRGWQAGAATRRRRTFIIGDTRGRSSEAVSLIRDRVSEVVQGGGPEDTLPLCLPWKGGPSLERLASCIVEDTEADPTRIRESDGISRWVADTHLYLMFGNAVPPPMARLVGEAVMDASS